MTTLVLELFLEFAIDAGAIDEPTRAHIQDEAAVALGKVVQLQTAVVTENNPRNSGTETGRSSWVNDRALRSCKWRLLRDTPIPHAV